MKTDIKNIFEAYKTDTLILEGVERQSSSMTKQELVNYLMSAKKGTTFVSVDYESPIIPLKKRRDNKEPIPETTSIKKSMTVSSILTNRSYTQEIQSTLQKREYDDSEGGVDYSAKEWKSEPLWARADGTAGGERVSNYLAVNFKSGEYYFYMRGKAGEIKVKNVVYKLNGTPVDFSEIRPMVGTNEDPELKAKNDVNKKQSEFGIESEDQVRPRLIAIRNIKKVRIDGLEISVI